MEDRAEEASSVIVTLPAEIDVINLSQVHARLSAAVASGAPVIIADLTATSTCDAGAVRHLVMIREDAAARGSQLRLVIPPGSLMRRMLVLFGVDHLLPVYPTIGKATDYAPAARQDPLSS